MSHAESCSRLWPEIMQQAAVQQMMITTSRNSLMFWCLNNLLTWYTDQTLRDCFVCYFYHYVKGWIIGHLVHFVNIFTSLTINDLIIIIMVCDIITAEFSKLVDLTTLLKAQGDHVSTWQHDHVTTNISCHMSTCHLPFTSSINLLFFSKLPIIIIILIQYTSYRTSSNTLL